MKYFIGIIPPDKIYNTILDIQQQFGDNRLEPHITIRPPVIPVIVDSWINAIQNVANSFPAFDIHLPATGYFGKRVLFIKVEAIELNTLYNEVVTAIKPFEPMVKEDGRDYHPHLTLGRNWCGFTKDDFKQMEEMTERYLSIEPISFTVESIRVYQKPDHKKRYEKLVDFSLNIFP